MENKKTVWLKVLLKFVGFIPRKIDLANAWQDKWVQILTVPSLKTAHSSPAVRFKIIEPYIWSLVLLLLMPHFALTQCATNITGTGIGSGVACTSPNSYSYQSANYTSTVTQSGWTYTWSLSPNGSIDYGQGTATIGVVWNSAPTGSCASWVNLVVSNGSGCTYNYGAANGVAGKCVNVQLRPSPNHTGPGMPGNYFWACKYDVGLNNLNQYNVTNPCTGCSYSWSASGGTVMSGQGGPTAQVKWLNASQYYWSNTLDLYVTSPNGCSADWSTQEGTQQAAYVTVSQGSTPGPISGPTTTYTNGCIYRYTGSHSTFINGGQSIWLSPGGTQVAVRWNNAWYGWSQDTVDIIWNSPGPHTLVLGNSSLGTQCAASSTLLVNTISSSVGIPNILGNPFAACLGTINNIQATTYPGYSLNWNVQNGIILAGQGTSNVQVQWTSPGNGRLILRSSAGLCDYLDTLDVLVPAPNLFSLGADTSFCDGAGITIQGPINAASYLWSTAANTSSIVTANQGPIWLMATDSYGCTASDTIQLTVFPNPIVNLGNDSLACGDSVQLIGPTGMYAYQWNTGEITHAISASTPGIYALQVNTAAGCMDQDTILIGFAAPNVISLGPDITLCGTQVQLNGPSNQTQYTWSNGATTPNIMATTSSNYALEAVDANGCIGADTVQVTIHAAPAINLGPDQVICQNTAPLAAPSGFAAYNWSTGQSTNAITCTASGDYAVQVTDANGCQNSDTVHVDLVGPNVISLGPDITLCGTQVQLNGPSNQTQYTWSNGATTPNIMATTSSNYALEAVDANGCIGADTVQVTIHAAPAINLGPDQVICQNTAPLAAPSGFVAYNWSTGQSTNAITCTASGDYAVQGTDANGCQNSDTVHVDLVGPNVISLGPDIMLCGTQVQLNGPSNQTQYTWSNGATTPNIMATTSSNYALEAVDANGCIGADTVSVTIYALPNVNLALNIDTLCSSDATPTVLAGGIPAGGNYSGAGVSAGAFTATVAGVGTHVVNYAFTDSLGCSNIATDTIIVAVCVGLKDGWEPFTLSLFPNPNDGRFTFVVLIAVASTVEYEVIDARGVTVRNAKSDQPSGPWREEVKLAPLANGLYTLKVTVAGQTAIRRFVVGQ